jgi:hypothetical protein
MTRERRGEWELGRLGRKSRRAMGAPSTCGLSAPDLSRAVGVASPRIVFAITPLFRSGNAFRATNENAETLLPGKANPRSVLLALPRQGSHPCKFASRCNLHKNGCGDETIQPANAIPVFSGYALPHSSKPLSNHQKAMAVLRARQKKANDRA